MFIDLPFLQPILLLLVFLGAVWDVKEARVLFFNHYFCVNPFTVLKNTFFQISSNVLSMLDFPYTMWQHNFDPRL
jgi:hypothetical protein